MEVLNTFVLVQLETSAVQVSQDLFGRHAAPTKQFAQVYSALSRPLDSGTTRRFLAPAEDR
ncbi:hypothetical protein [Ramlibacter sp.]|uniref:hypothetical protein n=1 Tax=Ramlibacter sp. TaxID=1917967 RepID=UPI002FC71BBB